MGNNMSEFFFSPWIKDHLTGRSLKEAGAFCASDKDWMRRPTSPRHERSSRRKSSPMPHDPFGSRVKSEIWERSFIRLHFCPNHLLGAERKQMQTWQDSYPKTPKEHEVSFTSRPRRRRSHPSCSWSVKSKLPVCCWRTTWYQSSRGTHSLYFRTVFFTL